jgi:hypothetical protein
VCVCVCVCVCACVPLHAAGAINKILFFLIFVLSSRMHAPASKVAEIYCFTKSYLHTGIQVKSRNYSEL